MSDTEKKEAGAVAAEAGTSSSTKQPASATSGQRLPRSLLFSWNESAAFWAILAGVVLFNHSERGRRFYEGLWKAYPNDNEGLAGTMYRGITAKVSAPVFFGFGLFYAFVDFFKPSFIYRTRISPRPPPSWQVYLKTFIWIILYQTFVTGPMGKLYYAIWKKRGGMETIRKIPSVWRTIAEFVALEAAFEINFYASHRLMHHPFFYRWVHKVHHENRDTFAFAAGYAHPVEQIVSNSLPFSLPPALLAVHPSTLWAYISWRILETSTAHSGYDIPFLPNATFHGFHHANFEGNYGVNCGVLIVDHLLGTSAKYEKWLAQYRSLHDGSIDRKKAAKEVEKLDVEPEEQKTE